MNQLTSITVIITISCCLLKLRFFSKPSFTFGSPNPHTKSHPKFHADCFCKLLGNKSRERSTTGKIILFTGVIARIYGPASSIVFEHNSYIWINGGP